MSGRFLPDGYETWSKEDELRAQLAAANQRDEQRRVLLDDAQVLARDAQRRAADAEIALAAATQHAEAAEAKLAFVGRYGADQWRRGNAGQEPQDFEEWRRESARE